METIHSQDGTPIAYQRSGAGQALLLVHGTSADHHRWTPVLPALEQHFTVYAVDRRGRGESGDAGAYSIEREFEDIAAVVGSISGPVNVLGHSYGGECSLGAALLTNNLHQLILYEPDSLQPGDFTVSPEKIRKMERLLDSGERDATVTVMFREILELGPDEFEHVRSAPSWAGRVAAAHTIPRELASAENYVLDLTRLSSITVPTLFLLGGDSPPIVRSATETLHKALPNSRIVLMPGQGHIAMNTAPDLFVREVIEFLTNQR